MIKHVFLFLPFVFIVLSSFSQVSESIRLTSNDLPGMELKRWSIYDQNTLWGYINGGADLYMEYGLIEVVVQDVKWEDESFKVDAYFMKSPQAAFGIFSVSRFNCLQNGVIAAWDCLNKQQVQVAHSNLYLSVISYSGTEHGGELAQIIAKKIVEKVTGEEFTLPNAITLSGIEPILSSVKLITGQLAIQNSYTSMEETFRSISDYLLWVVPFEKEGISHTLILVKFTNTNDLQIVNERLKNTISENFQIIVTSNMNWLVAVRTKGTKPNPKVIEELSKNLYNIDG